MDEKEALVAVVAAKTILDHVKGVSDEAKSVILEAHTGRYSESPMIGGYEVGTVTRSNGRQSFRVVDDAALLEWVKENAPEQIRTVETVNPEHVKRILADVTASGELPPGVEPAFGDPYVSVRQTAVQKNAVISAWQAGELHQVLPEVLP